MVSKNTQPGGADREHVERFRSGTSGEFAAGLVRPSDRAFSHFLSTLNYHTHASSFWWIGPHTAVLMYVGMSSSTRTRLGIWSCHGRGEFNKIILAAPLSLRRLLVKNSHFYCPP